MKSKNNHVVRRYGYHYRYDTEEERETLSALWKAVCLKMNYFTATKKPIGWTSDASGKHKRVYDRPQTPMARLLKSEVLSGQQVKGLEQTKAAINPANLTREITRLQNRPVALAKDKTDNLTAEVEEAKSRRLMKQKGGVKVVAV